MIMKQTKAEYVVLPFGGQPMRFSKANMLPVLKCLRKFPCYKLRLEPVKDGER
jgi:hypothetical protein